MDPKELEVLREELSEQGSTEEGRFGSKSRGTWLCVSQEAPGSASPPLSSSPVPSPGGSSMEQGYQRHPWPEQVSGPGGQSEEGEDAAPVPG